MISGVNIFSILQLEILVFRYEIRLSERQMPRFNSENKNYAVNWFCFEFFKGFPTNLVQNLVHNKDVSKLIKAVFDENFV